MTYAYTGYADCLLAGSGWKCSIPIPLASKLYDVYLYRLCWLLASGIRMEVFHPDPVSKQPVWLILYLLLCVQCKTPDDRQKARPKHMEFYSKTKFWEISASHWFYYKKVLELIDTLFCISLHEAGAIAMHMCKCRRPINSWNWFLELHITLSQTNNVVINPAGTPLFML